MSLPPEKAKRITIFLKKKMYKKTLQEAVSCGIPQERVEEIWIDVLDTFSDDVEMGTMRPHELQEKFRKRLVSEFPQLEQK